MSESLFVQRHCIWFVGIVRIEHEFLQNIDVILSYLFWLLKHLNQIVFVYILSNVIPDGHFTIVKHARNGVATSKCKEER